MTAQAERKLKQKRAKYVAEGLSKNEINKRMEQVRISTVSKPQGAKNKAGKHMVARVAPKRRNPYLAALLDPEHHEPYGVPDEFGRLVHRAKIVTQRKMTFLGGVSEAIIRPTLKGILQTTTDQVVSDIVSEAPFSVINNSTLIQNGRRVGFYDGGGPTLYAKRDRKFNQLGGSSYVVWDPPHDSTGNPSPIAAVNVAGNIYKALIIDATQCVFQLFYEISNPSGVTVTPYVRVWDGSTLTKITDPPTTTSGDFGATFTITGQTHLLEYGLEGSGAVGDCELISVYYTMQNISPAAPGIMETYDIGTEGDFELLSLAGRTYRISALSCWAIYTGALTSNGQLASAFVETRDDPQATSLTNYANLSVVPNAYVGPLAKGSYTFWEPTGIEDVKFRDINNFDQTLPFIAVSALANSVEAQEVTLRIVAHVELQTTNQVLAPRPSHINPVEIWEAFDIVRTICNSMENDTHLQKIARVIASGMGYAGDAAGLASFVATALGQPEIGAPLAALSAGSLQTSKMLNRYA